jgi:uncharacterized protein YfdQ (DUF2303 family)
MDDDTNSPMRDLAEWAQRRAAVNIVDLCDGVAVAAVPRGTELKSIKPLLDEYRTAPERRRGTAQLGDLASFIAHVGRFKDADSALFAQRDPAKPSLTGVLNYHLAGPIASAAPRFGDHRAFYAFPLSREWKAWREKQGAPMAQGDFAAFLEDRIVDVIEPPNAETTPEDALLHLRAKIGGVFAGPAKLLDLSRGLNAEQRVIGNVTLASGEATISFAEEHRDAAGDPIRVPSLFVIGIPIFDRGTVYRLAVRLRYRVKGGQVIWFYELYQADRAFDDAIGEAAASAQAETGLPLYYGTPEG